MWRAALKKEENLICTPVNKISPGMWVVYFLAKYERQQQEDAQIGNKYSARWSLPARVETVNDKVCVVTK